MKRYHVNGSGEPGVCKAQHGGCPFGGSEAHFASKAEAREDFESKQPTTFGRKTMDHKPRPNWRVLTDREHDAVIANYRQAMRKMRSVTFRETRAQEMRQSALAATAERYRVPVSQVKSIVQISQKSSGQDMAVPPKEAAERKFEEDSRKVLAEAPTTKDGKLICSGCGITDGVRVVADPYKAEIHERLEPIVVCPTCRGLIAEEI